MRKEFHIAIDFQYRKPERNLANLEEERKLAADFGVHSCKFEIWENETLAMSYSAKESNENAKVQAANHLLKMIIRKYDGKKNIRLMGFSINAEGDESFYKNYLIPFFKA